MSLIKRKPKPKKLSLRQIHSLYLLLKHALPEKEEELLIDEIEVMIRKMKNGDVLIQAVEILYPNNIVNKNDPLKILALFINGLTESNFFDYVQFIGNINGR